jgi:PPOX class probable F420-dependent enzyme
MADTLEGPARALFAGTNFAHLSVPRKDGSVQSAVLWIDLDDEGRIVVNSAEGRAWPKNLRREGRATISIHNQEKPYEYVSVTATLTGDTNEGAVEVIEALSRKYTGGPYPGDLVNEQRVTFTLTPERVSYHG